MTVRPDISVCIANYNGENYISACIDSVLQQAAHLKIEILIHDDASTDRSVNFIQQRYPTIKLIISQQNVGYCVSNNRLAEIANGKYLLFLNNDASLFDDALQTLFNFASTTSQPAILTVPQYAEENGELIDNGCWLDPFLNAIPNKCLVQKEVAVVAGACLWIAKKDWNEIEGFPPWFESMAEDLYLCCIARLYGYKVIALGQSGYKHHVGKSFGGGKITDKKLITTFNRRQLSERNKTITIILCYPRIFLIIFLPFHILLLCIEGGLLTFIKMDLRFWNEIYKPALVSLWSKRKKVYLLRQTIQSNKSLNFPYFFLKVFRLTPRKLFMLLKFGLPDLNHSSSK